MGTSYTDARYTINGTVLTQNTVMDNMSKMANSCGCWITYDVHQGKWAVIINRAGTSMYSFDDSNIIGPVKLANTGIDTLYNSMKATFMHEDLDGQTDFVEIEVPEIDRFPNETPNELSLTYDLVTDPVQAQLLGFIELKQSRVDKVITFTTDYSKIGVKAGDIIDITNSVYGFVADLYRVITVREMDNDQGGIDVEIMALDYDATVYDESNLNRYIRTGSNGLFDTSILPAPRTPDIIKYEEEAVPRITATTSLVGGLVDVVEYWITEDVPPAVSNDDDRTYHMLTYAIPPTGANVFVLDESITVDVAGMEAKNFLIKCRSKNAYGISPYSDPSGLIEFDPKPVAAEVNGNTAGDSIVSAGFVRTMLITDKIVNPLTTTVNDTSWHYVNLVSNWIVPVTGSYRLTLSTNWGALDSVGNNQCENPDGVMKITEIQVSSGGAYTSVNGTSTGDFHAQMYEDHFVQGIKDFTKGDSISIRSAHICNGVGKATPAIASVLVFENFEIQHLPYQTYVAAP